MPRRYENGVDVDRLVSRLVAAGMLSEPDKVRAVGLGVNEDGVVEFACRMRHLRDSSVGTRMDVIDPSALEYVMVVNGIGEHVMAHRYVTVGAGTVRSRLEVELGEPVGAAGETVRMRLEVRHKKKTQWIVFDGEWEVPEARHALGHPEGRSGYMVPVFERAILFLFDCGKVSLQCNLEDPDAMGEAISLPPL